MKTLRNALAICLLLISASGLAQNLSNTGKEFWVGYGHHQFMEPGQDNSQEMVLYFAAQQAATVTVNIWGTSWTRTYNVPAGGVIASDLIPKAGAIDARLISLPCSFVGPGMPCGGEGVFANKAIHITSTVPVVAYAHIYGSASSGATMLMPTETWGYAYTSVNSVQNYADNCFSWMYVIAKENNTVIEVTPITASRTGKAANVPHTVTLNKGEIYQIMGGGSGSAKPEMTGSRVKSIANSSGQCFPIAVFSGSSRTTNPASCGSGGGDNDNQQLFPSVAWGKRYLTAPTSSSTGAANKMRNIFKIVVRDTSTIVKRNGVQIPKSTLLAQSYYTYESNTEDYIESDKPIMVAQFMNGASSCLNGGNGDPEMIIISPIEQGIKRIGFYRNVRQGITTNYLTLIIPTAGVASLRIDGSSTFDHTYPHTKLPGYTVVIKRWAAAPAQSTAFSDSAFTAITYGLGSVESYGYNAGTLINNLAAKSSIYNVADSALKDSVQLFTCKGTPADIYALVGYKPTNMLWRLSQVPQISPNADVNVSNPVIIDSVQEGLGWYYRYKLPGGPYTFSDTGTFYIPIVNTEPTIESCTRTEEVRIAIVVKAASLNNMSISHTGCLLDTVYLNSSTNGGNGHTINKWAWSFGDGTTSSAEDTTYRYSAVGTYTIKLRVTTPQGCIGDTTKTITIGNKPVASIVVNPSSVCEGAPVTLSDTTTLATTGTWYWDFGNSTNATLTSNTPQTVTYTTPKSYTIKHIVKTSATCVSDTVTATIVVNPKPAKPVVANPLTYCQNGTATPLTATAITGHTLTWYNNSSLTGGTTTAPTPSTTTGGTTYYYVTQTSAEGCVSDTSRVEVRVVAALTGNTISANQTVCSGSPASTLTGPAPTGGTGTYTYQWQQSTDGGATWTNVSGATGLTYSPGVLSTGTTRFRRVANSALCASTSNAVDIVVETNLMNYDISATQTICEGTTPALLDGQTPTGGTGAYTFQWQSSTDGVNWTVIPSATLEDFQPSTLTTRTYYRRITTGGNCPAVSSVVTININPTASGNISGPTNICQYSSGAVTFTGTAGTLPYTVVILVTGPGGATNTITQTVASSPASITVIPTNSTPGNYTVALQSVSDNGNCIRTTGLNTLSIAVTATPALTFTPAAPAICAGGSINLSASGATTYTWSPSAGLNTTTGATVSANPTATTTYTVSGTTNGCNGSGTVTVTVNPLPAKPVVAASAIAYCQNATATQLSATALNGHTLTWYNAYPLTSGSAAAPTPSTATAGTVTYYVTQTNSATNCVSDTARITVTVTPAIAGNTISTDQTLCAGLPAATLTGPGVTGGTNTYTYQWQQSTDGGATWTAISGATNSTYNPGILPSGTTRFRRNVNSGLCSSTSNVVSITAEVTLSNYEIGTAQTVCEGVLPGLLVGQTPSGGTGNYTYQWSTSTDGTTWSTIAGAIGKDYQPTALTTNTYFRRTASGGNCPATSAPVLITVNPLPNGSITAPSGICSYETANVIFSASAGTAPYTIQLVVTAPGGNSTTINQIVNSNSPASINVIPLNSAGGTYTVQLASITDSKGCTRSVTAAPLSIVVTAKPAITATATPQTICEKTPTNLTVNGATTYVWSPATGLSATTGNSITATPLVNTTYQVIGSTNGCHDTASVAVTVIALPARPLASTSVEYCLGAPATALSATALTGHTLTWYNNSSLNGGYATAPTPSTATAGTYTYYVTQTNSNGCVSQANVITVTVRPLPAVDFDLPAGVCMPNGTATFINRTTIPGNGTLSYSWDFDDNTPAATTKDAVHVYAAANSYDVTLTATSAYGCSDSRTKSFSAFFDKPVADFETARPELCQGQQSFFTDKSDPSGSTITKWWWNFGDGQVKSEKDPSHRYTRPDTFTVKLVVTTAIGCVSDTFRQDVVVHLQPRIDAGPSFIVPEGTTVQFKATANDTTTTRISWTPPFGLSNPNTLNPTLQVTENRVYTLVAVGDGNCTAMDTMMVRILKAIEVPNAFSPNGDGINDRWEIPNLADYPGAKVEVFNRWGQQVFLSFGYNRPWDGSFLGKALPLATYYYVITLNNGFKPVTGSVTIIK